jgi:hypothetical protein
MRLGVADGFGQDLSAMQKFGGRGGGLNIPKTAAVIGGKSRQTLRTFAKHRLCSLYKV